MPCCTIGFESGQGPPFDHNNYYGLYKNQLATLSSKKDSSSNCRVSGQPSQVCIIIYKYILYIYNVYHCTDQC